MAQLTINKTILIILAILVITFFAIALGKFGLSFFDFGKNLPGENITSGDRGGGDVGGIEKEKPPACESCGKKSFNLCDKEECEELNDQWIKYYGEKENYDIQKIECNFNTKSNLLKKGLNLITFSKEYGKCVKEINE